MLEYDAETKEFSTVCPELPGYASAGDTEEEARRNFKEAIQLYLEGYDPLWYGRIKAWQRIPL